jgi:hypothetical protein
MSHGFSGFQQPLVHSQQPLSDQHKHGKVGITSTTTKENPKKPIPKTKSIKFYRSGMETPHGQAAKVR